MPSRSPQDINTATSESLLENITSAHLQRSGFLFLSLSPKGKQVTAAVPF